MANANIPENPLFSNRGEFLHYTLVSIEDVETYLSNGFTLWGSPVYDGSKQLLLQVVIKPKTPKNLTTKEKHIFHLAQTGKKPFEIAKIIHLTPRTVSNYLVQIRKKMRLGENGGV